MLTGTRLCPGRPVESRSERETRMPASGRAHDAQLHRSIARSRAIEHPSQRHRSLDPKPRTKLTCHPVARSLAHGSSTDRSLLVNGWRLNPRRRREPRSPSRSSSAASLVCWHWARSAFAVRSLLPSRARRRLLPRIHPTTSSCRHRPTTAKRQGQRSDPRPGRGSAAQSVQARSVADQVAADRHRAQRRPSG